MAIGKWIPFGAAQSVPPNAPAAVPVDDQPRIISAADAKQFGLENFGNTCYANSVLQALYFCGPFRELLVQYPDPTVPDIATLPSPTATAPSPVISHPTHPPNVRRKTERKYSTSDVPQASSPQLGSSPNPQNGTIPGIFPIPSSPPTLLSALRSLYLHISKNPADKGTIAPRAFIEKLKELNEIFRGTMHQDAHEFLNYLLNRIVEEIEDDRRNFLGTTNGKNVSGEDLSNSIATMSTIAPTTGTNDSTTQGSSYHSTIVHRLFEGVLTSETRCLTCETVSSRDESFLDLSIDIEQNSSVTACLRQFSASEMLCQKNKFFCDSCCGLQEAEKRMKIKKLPNVLALHLKRFKYQEDVGKYIKLAYRVAFPLELRLFNTVDDAQDPDRLYELFAIVVHIGNGPHHGHYVTIIKARGVWMLFDDDTVDTIKESDIPNYFGDSPKGSAYVLYYQAVDLDMAALGVRQPTVPPAAPSTPGSTAATSSAPDKLSTLSGSEMNKHEPDSPALPPGLVDEPEVSDMDESGSPATPASQFSPKNALPAAGQPSLVVSIPPTSSPQASPPTPSGSGGGGGLPTFSELRSTLSLRRSKENGSGAENRKSLLGSVLPGSPLLSPASPSSSASRRPPTAQSTTSTADHSHHTHDGSSPVPSSPSAWPSGSNGASRERLPEKKSSGWFKRVSRAEASYSAPSAPLPDSPKIPPAERRPSTVRERSTPIMPSSPSSKFSQSSTGSMSSSVPPDHPLMNNSLSPSPPPARLQTEHKKSLPEIALGRKSDRAKSSSGKVPPRPSTAGAAIGGSTTSLGRGSPIPPVPPLPSAPGHVLNGEALTTEPEPLKGNGKDDTEPSGVEALHDGSNHRRQFSGTVPVAVGLGFTASEGTASSLSTSDPPVHTSSNWGKRATRKLSLTAPMLGFGRKHKDKEK